ncbi:cytochrome d ubiquinol oxidase subunit II [Desulfoglaeba alkanexedens]|uniref:Cytochrome d ubiquinol oxidase subunit II n=1 Tax=Desulfoglaeba alkanexedens ALDC TaxID=980445 RepID=A0A4P8KZS7_9BACT|nr:cytochrome d ubiquinol oxidase subunit II [Desulfoglaeba alkanexedens]QCQ20783.1 cytochrome d ubiquinol oxidase subunit II [Desulfoglaeba alkanexedens ALDC]
MLESIWFVLWGVLWAVYFMLDGFDLGLGTLMPVIARNDTERRIVYNAAGPFWDGNEVWLIAAGGVTFAAFPHTYAVMFSGLYSALMLILFALIFRGVAFEFRGKIESPAWRRFWDGCLVVGSFLPAFLFGVAFANLFQGIPIDGEGVYRGTLFTLLNPYGLLGGLLFLCLFLVHGCVWLAVKTEGKLHQRAARFAKTLWAVLAVVAAGFFVATWFATRLYMNYIKNPLLFSIPIVVIPAATVASLLAVRYFVGKGAWWKAWFASATTIVGATFFGLAGLYPNLIPSTLNPTYSMTIYNSASSTLTLKIMLGVALIFVPLAIAYQVWTYRLFRHKVTEADLAYEEAY